MHHFTFFTFTPIRTRYPTKASKPNSDQCPLYLSQASLLLLVSIQVDLAYNAEVERDLRTLWKAMEKSTKRTNMYLSVQEQLFF